MTSSSSSSQIAGGGAAAISSSSSSTNHVVVDKSEWTFSGLELLLQLIDFSHHSEEDNVVEKLKNQIRKVFKTASDFYSYFSTDDSPAAREEKNNSFFESVNDDVNSFLYDQSERLQWEGWDSVSALSDQGVHYYVIAQSPLSDDEKLGVKQHYSDDLARQILTLNAECFSKGSRRIWIFLKFATRCSFNKIPGLWDTLESREQICDIASHCSTSDDARFFGNAINNITWHDGARAVYGSKDSRLPGLILRASEFAKTAISAEWMMQAVSNFICNNKENRSLFSAEKNGMAQRCLKMFCNLAQYANSTNAAYHYLKTLQSLALDSQFVVLVGLNPRLYEAMQTVLNHQPDESEVCSYFCRVLVNFCADADQALNVEEARQAPSKIRIIISQNTNMLAAICRIAEKAANDKNVDLAMTTLQAIHNLIFDNTEIKLLFATPEWHRRIINCVTGTLPYKQKEEIENQEEKDKVHESLQENQSFLVHWLLSTIFQLLGEDDDVLRNLNATSEIAHCVAYCICHASHCHSERNAQMAVYVAWSLTKSPIKMLDVVQSPPNCELELLEAFELLRPQVAAGDMRWLEEAQACVEKCLRFLN